MCAAGFGWRLACAACGTYAWRVAAFLRVGKKLSCSIFIVYIDTQGRSSAGPGERGLERLFTHNDKLYNCAAGLCGNSLNRSRIAPDQRWQRHCAAGTLGWLT